MHRKIAMALLDRDRLTGIGKVLQPHGLKGELKVTPLTDDPGYYEAHCRSVIMDTPDGLRQFNVNSLHASGGHWILTLEGVTNRETADTLRGASLMLSTEQLKPLEPGEYFLDDLIGCEVLTKDGMPLGSVQGLMETGAYTVLEIKGADGMVLAPMTPDVVETVDIAQRRISINPPPGLLELNR